MKQNSNSNNICILFQKFQGIKTNSNGALPSEKGGTKNDESGEQKRRTERAAESAAGGRGYANFCGACACSGTVRPDPQCAPHPRRVYDDSLGPFGSPEGLWPIATPSSYRSAYRSRGKVPRIT